jgi:ubiquinone/menaquinone biosynthesis C-methylase UbiE
MNSKQYFNKIAGDWDSMRETFFSIEVREQAISVAGIQSKAVVADIGAGSGFITEGLVNKVLKIIAVDQSEKMLERMQEKFYKYKNIYYRLSGAERLPIADGEVDIAFANMYLHHVEDPPAAIKEMVRILKPGGRIVITDADKHDYEFLRTEQHDRWLGFDRDDIKKWFENTNLKNIKVDCVGTNCCPTAQSSGERAVITIFYAVGEK